MVSQQGRIGSETKTGTTGKTKRKVCLHVLVDLLTLSLVLESSLSQVNGEHTSDTNNTSNTTIDELGWEAEQEMEIKAKSNKFVKETHTTDTVTIHRHVTGS